MSDAAAFWVAILVFFTEKKKNTTQTKQSLQAYFMLCYVSKKLSGNSMESFW